MFNARKKINPNEVEKRFILTEYVNLNKSYPGRSTSEHDDGHVVLLRRVRKRSNFGRLRQLGPVVNDVVKGNNLDVLRKAWYQKSKVKKNRLKYCNITLE